MDTAPFPKCPKCGGTNNKLIGTHTSRHWGDATKADAKIYAFTCQQCGMSFTIEEKPGDAPDKPT